MVTAFTFLFWSGLFIVFYTYIGYGIVIFLISKFRRQNRTPASLPDEDLPGVTVLVAAYNEEQCIAEKIKNTLNLDYPREKLSVYVVTDGSSDSTPELVKKFHAVKLFHERQRKGKINAVNRVIKYVTTPIVVFSDANTLLNASALRHIVRHYQDEQVGGVAGEKRIFRSAEDNASASGEGLYWKYESFLKKKDAEVHSVVGAAGELFSIRTALFQEPPGNTIIEDFWLSMMICAKGYRFIYEPEAYAVEAASASVKEEWKRKVRICAGGFQAMVSLKDLLNPLRHGVLTFQYVSHRVLRWTLAPALLPVILFSNIAVAATHPVYLSILLAQLGFYVLALCGYQRRDKKVSLKGFFVPYYFLVMNMSVYAGFLRYLRGNQSVMWEKATRAPISTQSIKS